MDSFSWDFLHCFHVIVVIKVRVTSVKWSQIARDTILGVRVIILDTVTRNVVHGLKLSWRVDSCILIFHHKLFLSENLVGGEQDCVLQLVAYTP